MFNFEVKALSTCESAVAIVKAVMGVDDEASVFVRMDTHRVEVTSVAAGVPELLHAISDAGFAAALVPERQTAAAEWSAELPSGDTPNRRFEPDGTEFDSGDA